MIPKILFTIICLLSFRGMTQTCKSVFESIETAKKQTIQKMVASNNKSQNDALFDSFFQSTSRKLEKFSEEEMLRCGFLDKNYNPTSEYRNLLKKNGLELEQGEGELWISINNNSIYQTFKPYLSEEYLTYFGIINKRIYEDAALAISWSDFGKFIYIESEFVRKYPNSKKIKEVKERYANDLYFFLMGIDNSPALNDFEAQKAIKKFAEDYPNSSATKIVKLYLNRKDNMSANRFPNYIATEIEKMLGVSLYGF
jgi:hypothetical protein